MIEPSDAKLSLAERIARGRARTLELSREFLNQPEPPRPEPEDLSLTDTQTANLLREHVEPGSCPPPYLLFAAFADVLSEEHAGRIREHVTECLLCDILLDELNPPEGALSSEAEARVRKAVPEAAFTGEVLPELRPLPPIRRLVILPLLGLIAVIAIAVLGYLAFARREPSTPAAAPEQATAPRPVALDAPELIHMPPLPAPTDLPTSPVHDAAGIALPTVADLAPAFSLYNHADYAAAAEKFRLLVASFPSSEIPSLYLGVSELELDHNAPAQHALVKAQQLAPAKRIMDVDWYLAIADLRVGLQSEALPLLQSICVLDDNIHRPRACAIAAQVAAPTNK